MPPPRFERRCPAPLLALFVAVALLIGAVEAREFGAVAARCNATAAEEIGSTEDYVTCSNLSNFTFDVSLKVIARENDFCTRVECLQVFRALRTADALECAIVKGLDNVPLDKLDGQIRCFGDKAVNSDSNVIERPDPNSDGSSGSGSESPEPTTKPVTPPPTTDTPKPTTPKPSKTKAGSASGSGSNSSIVAPSQETSSGSGLDTATIVSIVGVSVGVIAVLASLWYAASKVKKKKKNRRSKHMRPTEADYYGSEPHHTAPQFSGMSASPTQWSSQQYSQQQQYGAGTHGSGTMSQTWQSGAAGVNSAFAGWDEELISAVRVPYEKLTFDQLISRGGYGEVYRGTYRGQVVAIKTLLPERRRDMRQIQSFLSEVKTMAAMEHDRIVHLIGVAWDSLEELSVVTEYLERGDLRSVLSDFEAKEHRPHGFDVDKIRIAMHVAHALTYLHSLQPVLLHRDLKSRNILLDNQLNAKLADFGVSRERADRTMTAGVGSSLWMAPEVMIGERYDEKADVFSFGVVLSELDQHTLPYSHALEPGTGRKLPDAVVLQMVSLGRIRVAFTDEDHSEMAQVAIRCVSVNPADRPTAAEVLHLIHQAWKRC